MVSVIIPCFNVAASIEAHITKLISFLSSRHTTFELVLVDDGSTDATANVLSVYAAGDSRIRVIALPHNQGKGAAVKAGILGSHGDIVFFTDADLPYDLQAIELFANAIEGGADVVLGTRYKLADVTIPEQKGHRTPLSRVFLFLANRILLTPVPDTQAGCKGFKGSVARELFNRVTITGFSFDVEVILLAQQQGLRVESVPVELVQQGVSNVHLIRDGLQMCLDLLRLLALRKNNWMSWQTIKQFLSYGAVGILNTVLSFAILNALMLLTGVTRGVGFLLISIGTFLLVMIHSFIWNRYLVFRRDNPRALRKEYVTFFVVTSLTALLNLALLHLIVDILGAPAGMSEQAWANIALLITVPVSVVCNFLGYKFFVFSEQV